MKIMIVDDHSDMRNVLRSMLQISAKGLHDVIECQSGEEAVEEYAKQNPDCVLMDFELGAMNGLEASKIIYKHDPKAEIIFVTGYNNDTLRKKAQELNVRGFVTKDKLNTIYPILETINQLQGLQ